MELWKAIPETNGRVFISTEGRVRSLLRDDRILKAQPDKKGYLRVRVTINGEKLSFKVHREVAKAFLPVVKGKYQVNHKDGDKTNNALSNLEWVDNMENANHAIKAGLWENVFIASSRTNASRKQRVVSTDIATGEKRYFHSISEAERYFNSRHICDVLSGKRNAAAGQRFERGWCSGV